MRRETLLSSLLAVAMTGFAVSSHAALVDTLKNPSTRIKVISGTKYLPTNYSKCANLSGAKKWEGYFWCPSTIGALTATQVKTLNSPPAVKMVGPSTSGGFSVAYQVNPITQQISLNGTRYAPSSYGKCGNLSAAVKWNGFFWCKSSLGTLSPTRVAALVSGGSTGGGTGGSTTTYSASLNWRAPSTREDGSPLALSDLKGYEIYYTSDDLTQGVTVSVAGGSNTTYALKSLKAGTYHFAISAIDAAGLKSELSPLVSAKVGQ